MTVLCHINDIADEKSKALEHGDERLFAVKKDGQIYVYRNHCPHLGVELNWLEDQFLDSDGALIQCTTHGALFLIEDGECVAGPCMGQSLEAIPFEIIDQQITLI
ncbi:Rieske (2Fe-2S) protein [Oceanicoccus sp. KOV_DT_Chl]|uniref:Rieske (2Fe-2S) protein n=1 Tax=Oceanicoccus sp. KOV_DT_Chl TaxID=1904639 RepID=UPI000C7AA01C|nr:Rieske (2Fe-2S) protein [Oceanicoccus sp. KOV_DT_Chl]